MRFALKIVCATAAIVAISLALSAGLLIETAFSDGLSREKERAFAEHSMMKLSLETAAVTYAVQGITLDETIIAELMEQLTGGRDVALLDQDGQSILEPPAVPLAFLAPMQQRELTISPQGAGAFIYVRGPMVLSGKTYTLLMRTNISSLYAQRNAMLENYLRIFVVVLLVCSALIFLISIWLTRPIARLARVSRRIAQGDLELRAKESGGDEVAEFTRDFNQMTQVLSEKVLELEEAVEQREAFVANFAHELKTPLTSIIGYADILRSQQLSQERVFKSASTIFSEGQRLESLSIKLLELMVTGKQELEQKRINPRVLAAELGNSLQPLLVSQSMLLRVRVQNSMIQGDPDLLKTLLYNLVDNARKASQPGAEILLTGIQERNRFVFCVRDYGRGIPKEELSKITQAFYMVDKSRARAQNGAGLGLALCEKIAQLHGSRLQIESALGYGTTIRFELEVARR